MAAIGLDELDRAALRLLQRDGRITNRDLSRALGLSETACSARVKRLEAAGYIVGYVAVLSEAAADHSVRAWVDVRLSDPNPASRLAFEHALVNSDDVVAAYRTSGPADYLIKVGANHVADIERVLERLGSVEVECHAVRESVILRSIKSPASQVTRQASVPDCDIAIP